ncbi:MAG: hypothetical protein HY537_16270 [Deltaproteobacteria bacterium]|nr:hypothetical protein [Deltaproteobacteria bacterium]
MKTLFIIVFCKILFASEIDSLEEAKGLESMSEPPKASQGAERFRYRSYLLLELPARKVRATQTSELNFPYAEASFSGTYEFGSRTQAFADFIGNYTQSLREFGFLLNQVGTRYQAADSWSFVLGKERNRRSPGLIISPSDFIHSTQNLPGFREDRLGVWLARISHQTAKDAIELLYLPFPQNDSYGFPTGRAISYNFVGRYFRQLGLLDIAANVGYFNSWKAGASIQALIRNRWKFYFDFGFEEQRAGIVNKNSVWSVLTGAGYEGSDKIIPRLEFYRNGGALGLTDIALLTPAAFTSTVQPFVRELYVIASVSLVDVLRDFNFTPTIIKSLDDNALALVLRAERYLGSNHTLGTSAIYLNAHDTNQYRFAALDWQVTVDWKWSF